MTLRARLTAAFLLVVLLPVLVGAVLVARLVPSIQRDQIDRQLQAAGTSAVLAVRSECTSAAGAAQTVGALIGARTPAATAATDVVSRGVVDIVVVLDASGVVRSVSGPAPAGVSVGSPAADLGDCQAGTGGAATIGAFAGLSTAGGGAAGRVWAGHTVTADLVRSWRTSGTNLTLVDGTRAAFSTLPGGTADRVARADGSHLRGSGDRPRVLRQVARGDGQPLHLVVSQPDFVATPLYALLGIVVLVALLVCLLIAWRLSRAVTSPLREVRDAAQRVAAGELSTRIPVRGRDEVGQLAGSFNTMTVELQSYVDALRASRDQLRGNLDLLGDTLSSTHDLNGILGVVLDTAMNAASAQGGAIYLSGPGDVFCKVARNVRGVAPDGRFDPARSDGSRPRIPIGAGIVGSVVGTGEAQRGRAGVSGPAPSPGEPQQGTWIAVPFTSSGRQLGVLALYDRIGTDDFDDADLLTIRTFAGQAAVAVDNVHTHHEVQRLSLTDELTGLRNYRSFQRSLKQEVERAARFGRPLALLMLDLDHFKVVNDEHGHLAGDAVLAEVARRVSSAIREVDVLARYGGEEMALLLPETDLPGAERLAARICGMMRERGFGDLDLAITVSVGVALFPDHGTDPASLVERADDALYEAKSAGRDTWRTSQSAAV